MKLVLDMNLSPTGVRHLEEHGPSVLQIRAQDVLPDTLGAGVVRVLQQHGAALDEGAIVSVDELTSRVRVLPIRRG